MQIVLKVPEPGAEDPAREVLDRLISYAQAWFEASPSRLQGHLLEETTFVCQVTTNTFGNSIDVLMGFINDMDPAPEEGRVLEVEDLYVEPGGLFARAAILIRGLVLHEFTKLPVAEHMHLVNTPDGWRILHVFATPRQNESVPEDEATAPLAAAG